MTMDDHVKQLFGELMLTIAQLRLQVEQANTAATERDRPGPIPFPPKDSEAS